MTEQTSKQQDGGVGSLVVFGALAFALWHWWTPITGWVLGDYRLATTVAMAYACDIEINTAKLKQNLRANDVDFNWFANNVANQKPETSEAACVTARLAVESEGVGK